MPRLRGEISRTSEIREMRLEKLKGTLVDFNRLEHVLDNCEQVATWQLEIRKIHDDPLELDELILHVQKSDGSREEAVRSVLDERLRWRRRRRTRTRSCFTPDEELRQMQGVGAMLKEQRVVDHRPATGKPASLHYAATSGNYETGEGRGNHFQTHG